MTLIFLVLLGAVAGFAQTAKDGPELTRLLNEFLAGASKNDPAVHDRFWADDLIYTHSSARIDTKHSLIDNMQSGATVYNSVEPSDVKAQDLGSAVVLTGVAQFRVTSGGKPNAFGARFTDVYANRGGKWQMVTWQSTRLAD